MRMCANIELFSIPKVCRKNIWPLVRLKSSGRMDEEPKNKLIQ